MDVNTDALIFGIWAVLAVFRVAVVLVLFLVIEYKWRLRVSLEKRLLKHENHSIAGSDKTSWTLQQFDNLNGKPWCALLQHDAAGVLRGWTGYRPELEALARILNITPRELPVTTSEEFFIRTSISALRPTDPKI